MTEKKKTAIWQTFAKQYRLSDEQQRQFQLYAQLLKDWNARINLTALTDLDDIVDYHFADSIEITNFIDMKQYKMIADIGAGAGFPGIPIKIMFPHLALVPIEVNNKKIRFMQQVVDQLGLSDVHFVSDDWRTFLRHSDMPMDLFLARASLQPTELIRMFKPASAYKEADLIYWASKHWQPAADVMAYIAKEESYSIGGKKRRYIFFSDKKR